ncbi:hypothetical protein GGR50DRAFT_700874 [Xylaria sp. CBS 124048]|nr:hypothetical protein GGR50DRAFT_700874 [Xylaria sp. CBS 124048]
MDYYQQQVLKLHDRYNLTDNARHLLRSYDNYVRGSIDKSALGRLVRISPANRATIRTTITQLATIMKNDHTEAEYCFKLIGFMNTILEIADEGHSTVGFHNFMRLPRELRDRIYDHHLRNRKNYEIPVVPPRKHVPCGCAAPKPRRIGYQFTVFKFPLVFVSKDVSREVLIAFYRWRTMSFPCACEMEHHLRENALLRASARFIQFHWCGPKADLGILQLRNVPVEQLIVIISKMTTINLTKRDALIHRFFGRRRSIGNNPSLPGLYEALGFDELVQLRGLKAVTVIQAERRFAERRPESDNNCLQSMLSHLIVDHRNNHIPPLASQNAQANQID